MYLVISHWCSSVFFILLQCYKLSSNISTGFHICLTLARSTRRLKVRSINICTCQRWDQYQGENDEHGATIIIFQLLTWKILLNCKKSDFFFHNDKLHYYVSENLNQLMKKESLSLVFYIAYTISPSYKTVYDYCWTTEITNVK